MPQQQTSRSSSSFSNAPPPPPPRHVTISREYQGIFSSSLCGMFENNNHSPQHMSKTDACALACCGVWLWERNQFLLQGKTPKTWRQRPLEMVMVLLGVSAVVVWTIDPEQLFLQVAAILIVSGILWKLLEFQHTRGFFRKRLAIYNYYRDQGQELPSEEDIDLADPGLNMYLRQHRREIHGVHALCGCSRIDYFPKIETTTTAAAAASEEREEPKDFCHQLWQFLAALCCGACCFCWCQFCGMCAIAQEHRHLKKVLPPNPQLWQCDYITMQPWEEYAPSILELRANRDLRVLAHMRALSVLSSRLLKAVGILLLVTVLVTALPVHYSRWELLVLLGTLLQPMIVLYFVHWLWNRLDISIDAIIKYFASGFFICTSMAILYEILVSSLAYMALIVSAVFGSFLLVLTGSMTINMNDDDNDGQSQDGPKVNVPTPFVIALAIFGAFLNAFFVAGLVEEIAKYLCFWMVEHPDMVVADEADMASNESRSTLPSYQGETREPQYFKSLKETVLPPVSLTSRGAAITIAMVTTALGFACAENLLYVFVYTPPGIEAELSTLIVRCMFPVHPLAAALQSIGVCRRDLEHDPSTHIGRIIFPAWLLHGTFDFVLMAFAVVAQVLEAKNEDDDDGEDSPAGEEEDGTEDEPVDPIENLKSSAVLLSVVLLIPLLGLVYYFKEAWAQRKRLKDLDSPLERTCGSEIPESASETAERTLLLSRGF